MRVRVCVPRFTYIALEINNEQEKIETFLVVSLQHTPTQTANHVYSSFIHLSFSIEISTTHTHNKQLQKEAKKKMESQSESEREGEMCAVQFVTMISHLIHFTSIFYPPLFIHRVTYCQIHNSLRVASLPRSLSFPHFPIASACRQLVSV